MNTQTQTRTAPSISGNTIDLGAGHSIAIYQRNGEGWVAEFQDGYAQLEYAGSWFRFHAGELRAARAALESATPLTPGMLERIERLHRDREAREEKILAAARSVAAAAQRYWVSVLARLGGGASKISQTVG